MITLEELRSSIKFRGKSSKFLPESSNTDISVFFDTGSVWGVDYDEYHCRKQILKAQPEFLSSWLSPVGPMSFVFASSLKKASTDKTEFFNFNLGTSF